MERRDLLKKSFGFAAGGAVALIGSRGAFARTLGQVCGFTPAQTEGPFYPVQDQADKDNDLTQVKGRTGRAVGQVIYLQGRVIDDACQPVKGALVEIWQACASGRYNHPSDPNTAAALDPDFQYWGRATTDADGRYGFKSILPGAYPADTNWMRPPHIHFKVYARGFHDLTTQMYFKGQEYNATDKILQNIPAAERERVVVEFAQADFDPAALSGAFDIAVKRVR